MTRSSSSIVIKKEMNENNSIEIVYRNLCLDLNLDNETKIDAWRCYEHIRKHYYLEGDQIHWLAISLYVSCRRNNSLLQYDNNPISIKRLLESANHFELMNFFDKLHKWEDMANLPDYIRRKIDQIEYSFQISTILFEKYSQIFLFVFGGNLNQLNSYNYLYQRTSNQINPKFNLKQKKDHKYSIYYFYSFIWTIYAFNKTIYPSTFNDLIASFHLLICSFQFIYQYIRQHQLYYLLKGECFNDGNGNENEENLIDLLCLKYNCSSEMSRTIYEEHFINNNNLIELKMNIEDNNLNNLNNLINKKYDEIVLTNCIIDERLFLENSNQFYDLCHSLNENKNSKITIRNQTPLTANQHFISSNQSSSSSSLTPISQANQLIQLLYSIVYQQTNQPNQNLISIIGEQHFIDDLVERLNEWENKFNENYDRIDLFDQRRSEDDDISIRCRRPSDSCKCRFDLALKLFYNALETILIIEKKRLISIQLTDQQIHQSFHKLILNNEFLKSLLGLCLLLVFYSHSDLLHDFNWILNLYSLHGYSFLKIIQIYLKTSKQLNQCRTFIKYLSSIEEIILSSMAFQSDSALWNEIQNKGIITYQQIQLQLQQNKSSSSSSSPPPSSSITTPTNLTSMYFQSPNPNHVKRKLFQNSTIDQSTTNCLSIIRSRSDPLTENISLNPIRKMSPYIMFYRKLYELIFSRLDLLCLRLYGNQSNELEKYVWNLFLNLFENQTKFLFCSRDIDQILISCIYYISNSILYPNDQLTWTRLIQIYKSMPNSKLKTLRSVFIRQMNSNEFIHQDQQQQLNENPCLTPSKPAGTIHQIDGNILGDISSFYNQIFLQIPNLHLLIQQQRNQLIDLPPRRKYHSNQTEHHLGQHLFVHYSTNSIQSNLSSSTNQQNQSNTNSSQHLFSSNILSSSIQAGANNTVQTTRTRTEDGKFLTTISTSTISKMNDLDRQSSSIRSSNSNEMNLFFGQSSNHSFKRTLSNDSNSNCLTSLTKKVLQIENDRQQLHQS